MLAARSGDFQKSRLKTALKNAGGNPRFFFVAAPATDKSRALSQAARRVKPHVAKWPCDFGAPVNPCVKAAQMTFLQKWGFRARTRCARKSPQGGGSVFGLA